MSDALEPAELEPMVLQVRLDREIDAVLDTLTAAAELGVEVDPLETILRRVQARGHELNLDDMPPLARMILGGMLEAGQ